MRKPLLALAAAFCLALPAAASAELAVGASAPRFVTAAALGGRVFSFDLGNALRRGPVVLYFFPRAFTQGCTLEANAFAEAMDAFEAAGAQVIGLSGDDLATLQRFSREECRDEFPVGRASAQIIRQYDVALGDGNQARRTSYVIARDGRVRLVHADMDWREHVSRTLAAVRALED
jgi:peroxiredoxin